MAGYWEEKIMSSTSESFLIEIVGRGQLWQNAGYEAMLSVNATLHQRIDTQSDKQTAAFCVHMRTCNPI